MGTENKSFEELLDGLKALRPFSVEKDDRVVFRYGDGNETKNAVSLVPGKMEGIDWMDIFIGINTLRADRLEWATALLQMNRELFVGSPIPKFMALDDLVGVSFVHRLDWKYVSARVLDGFIVRVLDEVHSGLITNRANKPSSNDDEHESNEENIPSNAVNRSFADLLRQLRLLRPLAEGHEDADIFDYDGGVVNLIRGTEDGIHWVDIVVRLVGFSMDRLDWAKYILQSNGEMCQCTPIPTWFATDESNKLLFINRLDWQYVSAAVLDDHIRRCIDEMRQAVIEEGVGVVSSQRHGTSGGNERDFRRET